jgi:hypothetical protein
MTKEVKINIGVDGVSVETEDGFGAWSKEFLSFDYGNWRVYVESDYLDCFGHLVLQFTDDGKILLSCDDHYCDDEEYDDEEIEEIEKENADGCCKYKNFEITDNYSIEDECFTIKFVKN